MNATACSRCDRSISLDDSDVTLDGRTYHRDCGFIEASEKGFHYIRASHKWQAGVCLGVYDTPLHPPAMRVCQEAGLLHCENDNSHINASTFAALKHWHQPTGANTEKASRACDGWDIDRTMRRLIGMLEATTLAFDHMEHWNVMEGYRFLLHNLAGVKCTPSFLIPGGLLEVAQCAALCCNLALKTLYAVHNPTAPKEVFRDMSHDMSEAWDKIGDERGILIGIVRAMPVFPLAHVDDEDIRHMLSKSADFDELRWSGGETAPPFALSALPHLRLAWATYLRCDELIEYDPISPQLHAFIQNKDSEPTPHGPSAVRQLHRPEKKQLSAPNTQQGHVTEDSIITPDWLRLAEEIPEIDRKHDLFKSDYGLLHRASGAYVTGSTHAVLRRWAIQEPATTKPFPITSSKTALGDTYGLAAMLSGRLECITGNYALSAHLINSQTIDGLPAVPYFIGELILYTQSAVFVCELAIKWLYSLCHPEAPLTVYKKDMGHYVLIAWKHISDHHDEILRVFHAMPLFQGDGDLHEREHVSDEKMLALLSWFSTTYYDARYGITDPGKERSTIPVDYRINLHLAWAVYLYGARNLNRATNLPHDP